MKNVHYLKQFTSRKVKRPQHGQMDNYVSLHWWVNQYLQLAVTGVRSEEVCGKISLHLNRFTNFFVECYGHDKITTCLKRDVLTWRDHLRKEEGFAPATVNNHLASLSGFTSWVHTQESELFPAGDPTKKISELGLPPLEPRTLSEVQVRSLKNLCDRLERFHQLKGRRWNGKKAPIKASARPWRDRAIIFTLLSTGLRRQELVRLNFDQLEPNAPEVLRNSRKARINRVLGKGNTERTVFLSHDARQALADYLEKERNQDESKETLALFLSASCLPARKSDGRLSTRAINLILSQIGQWHDAEIKDTERKISPLRPHNLRHTFAFQLAKNTGADAYELERRLGHRSQRYIQRYTNPPEEVAASYVEDF